MVTMKGIELGYLGGTCGVVVGRITVVFNRRVFTGCVGGELVMSGSFGEGVMYGGVFGRTRGVGVLGNACGTETVFNLISDSLLILVN